MNSPNNQIARLDYGLRHISSRNIILLNSTIYTCILRCSQESHKTLRVVAYDDDSVAVIPVDVEYIDEEPLWFPRGLVFADEELTKPWEPPQGMGR